MSRDKNQDAIRVKDDAVCALFSVGEADSRTANKIKTEKKKT